MSYCSDIFFSILHYSEKLSHFDTEFSFGIISDRGRYLYSSEFFLMFNLKILIYGKIED